MRNAGRPRCGRLPFASQLEPVGHMTPANVVWELRADIDRQASPCRQPHRRRRGPGTCPSDATQEMQVSAGTSEPSEILNVFNVSPRRHGRRVVSVLFQPILFRSSSSGTVGPPRNVQKCKVELTHRVVASSADVSEMCRRTLLTVGMTKENYEMKGAGRSIRDIARELDISCNTVRRYPRFRRGRL